MQGPNAYFTKEFALEIQTLWQKNVHYKLNVKYMVTINLCTSNNTIYFCKTMAP